MKKRIILLMLVAMLVVSLAACGGDKKEGETTTLRVMNRVNPEVSYEENNEWVKAVEEAAGVKLEIEAPAPSNYNDKLQITMASGNLPDIIYIFQNDNNYAKWAGDGLLLELDDEIDKYPNLKENISAETFASFRASTTGKIHAIPKSNQMSYWGYVVNEEWLKKLGMDAPETLEEFYEFAKAVSNSDPDGNGRKDTFAISPSGQTNAGASVWEEYYLLSAFDLISAEDRLDENGEFKRRQEYEGYYPYLEFMRKLYEEKLIDPEFFLNKSAAHCEKFIQQRIGLFGGHDGGVKGLFGKDSLDRILNNYEYYPNLKNSDGERILYASTPVWGAWAISAETKNKDAALKFLDFGNSPEGWRIMNIGKDGVHYSSYNPETKELIRTDEQSELCRSEFSSYTSISATYKGEVAYVSLCDTPEKLAKYKKGLDNYLSKTKIEKIPNVVAPELIKLKSEQPDIFTKMDQKEIQYVTGEITLDELKAYVEDVYLPKTEEAYAEKAKLLKKAYN